MNRKKICRLYYLYLNAQTQKRNFILSGKTDLNFLFSNITIEASPDYQVVNAQNITQPFTILPEMQYYFPVEGKLKPFAVACVGYMWLQERDSRVAEHNNTVYSLSGPAFTGGVGASYLLPI